MMDSTCLSNSSILADNARSCIVERILLVGLLCLRPRADGGGLGLASCVGAGGVGFLSSGLGLGLLADPAVLRIFISLLLLSWLWCERPAEVLLHLGAAEVVSRSMIGGCCACDSLRPSDVGFLDCLVLSRFSLYPLSSDSSCLGSSVCATVWGAVSGGV